MTRTNLTAIASLVVLGLAGCQPKTAEAPALLCDDDQASVAALTSPAMHRLVPDTDNPTVQQLADLHAYAKTVKDPCVARQFHKWAEFYYDRILDKARDEANWNKAMKAGEKYK